MATKRTVICPSCGFKNSLPLPSNRCVSCGAKIEDLKRTLSHEEALERRYQQEGFSMAWLGISVAIMGVLSAALVIGLPMVVPTFDFEGSAGMMVAIPVWFVGGMLIGLISPGKTFVEPVVAVFIIAIPVALFLHRGQTVKTMPPFMYMLMSGLGALFTLIGAYIGERIQMGPPPKPTE